MFNEYEVYKMMKLRQEETERNAQNAWEFECCQKEAFFQKWIKELTSSQKSTVVKANRDSACNCCSVSGSCC